MNLEIYHSLASLAPLKEVVRVYAENANCDENTAIDYIMTALNNGSLRLTLIGSYSTKATPMSSIMNALSLVRDWETWELSKVPELGKDHMEYQTLLTRHCYIRGEDFAAFLLSMGITEFIGWPSSAQSKHPELSESNSSQQQRAINNLERTVAAMTLLLSDKHTKYKRGDKPNAAAISRDISQLISNVYGENRAPNTKNLAETLNAYLKKHFPSEE